MSMLFNKARLRFERAVISFVNDKSGAALVEMALVLPVMVILFGAALVVQDGAINSYQNSKAAYTVSDMVSREDTLIDNDYFAGLNSVFRYLVGDEFPTELRISTIECTADCESDASRVLEVCWSQPTDGLPALTTAEIASYGDRTPLFSEGDTLLMTEAFLDYTPLLSSIMSPRTFETLAFTRPRIVGQIKYDTGTVDLAGNAIIKDCFNN